MKILLSGAFNPLFEALPEYLAAALKGAGHDLLIFDHRAFLLPGRLRARVPLLDRFDRDLLNARLVQTVRRTRPDRLVVNQGMVLNHRTIESIREMGVRCVNWFSDYPAEFEAGLRVAPAYDTFYLGSSYAARRHREAGHRHANWLPFACDPDVHRPLDTDDPPEVRGSHAEVVFVGSYYPERQILLRFLRGLPVSIWGPGWQRAAHDPHLASMIRGGALRPSAWRRLYASARVAINIHYGAFGPEEVSGDLANTRVFEILACGTHQVSNRQGDVLRLFDEGVHLSAFSGGDELRAAVERALHDEDWRRAVARRGREAVLARHTYSHRIAALLDGTSGEFETAPIGGDAAVARPAVAVGRPMAAGNSS